MKTSHFPAHMANGQQVAPSHNLNRSEHIIPNGERAPKGTVISSTLRYSVGRSVVAGKRGNKALVIFENTGDFLAIRSGRNGQEIIAEYDITDSGSFEGNRDAVKARFFRDYNPKAYGFTS
jgi:hypothetical protein